MTILTVARRPSTISLRRPGDRDNGDDDNTAIMRDREKERSHRVGSRQRWKEKSGSLLSTMP
jgi:hypothetical protein